MTTGIGGADTQDTGPTSQQAFDRLQDAYDGKIDTKVTMQTTDSEVRCAGCGLMFEPSNKSWLIKNANICFSCIEESDIGKGVANVGMSLLFKDMSTMNAALELGYLLGADRPASRPPLDM